MGSLVVVGACYLDTILSVPHYPQEDEKLRATNIVQRRGGNGPNTLEVLQQLIRRQDNEEEPSLVLCSVLPSRSSPATQQIQSSFGRNVDLSQCLYRADHFEPASSYIIRSLANGSRTVVNYNALPEMTSAEFMAVADWLETDAIWYHFEGRIPDVILECIRHLRRSHPSAKISVEVEKPARAGLEQLAAEADVVFISRSWAQSQGYNNAEDCLRAQAAVAVKAQMLCCTWGAGGATAVELPTKRYHQAPAFKAQDFRVVDSTGAGDTFIAGMLFGLLCRQDWCLEKKLSFANELAGRKPSAGLAAARRSGIAYGFGSAQKRWREGGVRLNNNAYITTTISVFHDQSGTSLSVPQLSIANATHRVNDSRPEPTPHSDSDLGQPNGPNVLTDIDQLQQYVLAGYKLQPLIGFDQTTPTQQAFDQLKATTGPLSIKPSTFNSQ